MHDELTFKELHVASKRRTLAGVFWSRWNIHSTSSKADQEAVCQLLERKGLIYPAAGAAVKHGRQPGYERLWDSDSVELLLGLLLDFLGDFGVVFDEQGMYVPPDT